MNGQDIDAASNREAHSPRLAQTALLTALAMLAFAGNSLLCRFALKETAIDAASFASLRLVSGALALALIVRLRHGGNATRAGDWRAALALFGYAASFSYAYASLPAGTGALILFGAVQVTMITHGLLKGERLGLLQMAGFVAACGGLTALMLPGVHAPSLSASILMAGAGVAWGVYSLRGRGSTNPLAANAGNFGRASVLTLVLSGMLWRFAEFDAPGVVSAIVSGALTSGVGYAIWYTALRALSATQAAVVQLTVPVIAALGGVGLLGETLTLRLVVTSIIVLGGVAAVVGGAARRLEAA
ncbi:MAG: DMT family transporter [Burkholderiaceae bacterium]|nr:MAG: DMT family transporter [Burkholderiaceae bacterium]